TSSRAPGSGWYPSTPRSFRSKVRQIRSLSVRIWRRFGEGGPAGRASRALYGQQPPQLGDVPARHWDRLAVRERQLGGAAELRAELDRVVQVGHVLAVDADEAELFPAALDVDQG